MKNIKEKSIHSGHRSRLRNRVKKYGLDSLNEHEVLELLLGYAIPRKDTNPLAHNLINYFGSFAKVIDADFYDLLKVKGVGEETALFVKVLSSFGLGYRCICVLGKLLPCCFVNFLVRMLYAK